MRPSAARLISDHRNTRYGEVIAVFARDDKFEAEVYGTQLLNDCPAELWDGLDADAIAEEMGAVAVKLNGPRYWTLDGLGTKVAVVEPVLRDFGGLTTRRIAVVEMGEDPRATPCAENYVNRGAVFFFDAGKPVYELVSPEGKAYVMQAYCIGVDPTITLDSLESLGERLAVPDGWAYRTRVLDEDSWSTPATPCHGAPGRTGEQLHAPLLSPSSAPPISRCLTAAYSPANVATWKSSDASPTMAAKMRQKCSRTSRRSRGWIEETHRRDAAEAVSLRRQTRRVKSAAPSRTRPATTVRR